MSRIRPMIPGILGAMAPRTPFPRLLLAALSAALVAGATGCAGGPAVIGPPARPGAVLTGFSERLPDRPGAELYLRNNTDSPVTVTSISIYDCVNLAVWCETREVSIVLAPRQLRRMVVVEPQDPTMRWSYRWRWTRERGVAADARTSADRPAPAAILLDRGSHRGEPFRTLLDPRGRFVNLVLPATPMRELQLGDWSAQQMQEVARLFYRSFRDDFDFLMVALADADRTASNGGRAFRTRPSAEGLGLTGSDRAAAFGSEGRLQSVLMLGAHVLLDGAIPLHELAHTWGQYVIRGSGRMGHWGFSGVGGLLGGWEPGTLEEVGEGLWTAREEGPDGRRFSVSGPRAALRPYAPLELYLMGLLPADSVSPVQVAEDAEWVDIERGIFRASRVRTVSMEELVDRHGSRIPRYPDAPREFRGAYLVLSSAPLDDATRNRIDEDVQELTRVGPRDVRWYLNFWEATGGRGRLLMDGLEGAVRDPGLLEPSGGPG